ncbi:YybS family protein [Bacillus sp. FJAT-52991]|uniref:YybS family protein n=1 Tax=Bacillus kandeliae TaxID=3129297 RepID=A0ABZ2N767_9BACI
MEKKKVLNEGIWMLALFMVLLLVTIYVPGLSLVSSLFLVLPFLVFSAKYPVKPSVIFGLISLLAASVVGGLGAVPLALAFGSTGIVMGSMVYKKLDKLSIFMAGSLTFLLNIILLYVSTILLTGVNMATKMNEAFKRSFQESVDLMKELGQPLPEEAVEQIQEGISFFSTLTPSLFVLVAFAAVLLFILVNFPILKKLKIDVPHFQPFRMWRMPTSLLWYYLILLLLSFVAIPEAGSAWYSTYVNLMFMLQFCLIIQGLSFFYFFAYIKKWSKAAPIVLTIFSILFLPLLYLVRLLGIIDLGFDLRQRLQQKP